MIYKVAIKLGDSYSKEAKGYLASSRIRGHYLAKYWDECDDFFYPKNFPKIKNDFFNPKNQLDILKDYNAVILNKTYEWRLAELLREKGISVIVDCCDPDWLSSHSGPQRVSDCLKTFEYADCVVVNGKAMEKSVKEVYRGRVEIIPDRLDLEGLPQKKRHNDELKSIVWYGYSENLRVLEPYLKQIINMGLDITIISDKFFDNFILTNCKYRPSEKITFKHWHPDTISQQIIEHDCVFVGKDKDKYLSQFKSPNRAMTGYALNMPVAYDINDLKKLISREERIKDAFNGNKLCREKYDIRHSVYEYDKLIKQLINKRK